MTCDRCDKVGKSAKASSSSSSSKFPSVVEVAYLVNLEYYVKFCASCIHQIDKNLASKDDISIAEMVEYLDTHHWELVAHQQFGGLKTSTFLNNLAKQMVIVHRGTEKTNVGQLVMDWKIFRELFLEDDIKKIHVSTKNMIYNYALARDGIEFKPNEYSVTIAGHSLGGWLAQMSTLLAKRPDLEPRYKGGSLLFGPENLELNLEQTYNAHCIAFDSPGAQSVMWFLNKGPSNQERDNILKEFDINVYVSNANFVNTCGKHVGNVYQMDILKSKTLGSVFDYLMTAKSHNMSNILKYIRREKESLNTFTKVK